MKTTKPTITRPELETLACVNERCESYGQKGQNNLTVGKIYGKDGIRYLGCQCCGQEFSERKRTALWNTKVSEDKAIAVAVRVKAPIYVEESVLTSAGVTPDTEEAPTAEAAPVEQLDLEKLSAFQELINGLDTLDDLGKPKSS